jgi:putative hydrolase of the HAD superfamily
MTVRAILFDVGDTLLHVGEFPRDFGPRLVDGLPADCEPQTRVDACRRAYDGLTRELAALNAAGSHEEANIGDILVRLLAAEGLPVSAQHAQALGDIDGRADIGRLESRTGVADTLRELAESGYRLAAVSNTGSRAALLDSFFEECGLARCFEEWVYSSSLGVRKPHPRIYQHALDALGISGSEAVFVGDRVREDILGPRSAGIAHAILTHEHRQEDPGDSDPCAVIARLEELPAVLPGLH